METIKHGYGNDELHISRISIDYSQAPDSCSSGVQTLTIESDDAGGGVFMRIKTEGFAIDDVKDMEKILLDFKKRLGN